MNYLLFNFFKCLLLLRAPFKTVLLPGHLIERAYNLTDLGCASSKNPQCLRRLVFSFLLVGGDVAANLLITSIGI